MLRVLCVGILLLLVAGVSCQTSTTEDSVVLSFFLELDSRATAMAEELNLNITYSLSQNEIHFYDDHVPHITLYQSAFPRSRLSSLVNLFSSMKNLFHQCTVVLRGGSQFGSFIIWNAEVNLCLSELNISLANNFEKRRVKDQPIPRWVIDEPDTETRKKLTESFIDYGYPFIALYGTFQSGVTVGYDSSENLHYAFDQLNFPSITFVPTKIGLAITSAHDSFTDISIIDTEDLKRTY